MKNGKIIQHMAIIVLIILLFTFFRIALPAMPYDQRLFLGLRFIVSGGFSGTDWLLWDVITAIAGICCIFAVPVEGDYKHIRRFLLRPAALILVFVLSTPFVNATVRKANAAYLEQQRQQHLAQVEESNKAIREFIEIADEAYAYSNTQHQGSKYLTSFPELVLENKYVTDTLMIDYDTMTLGFSFYNVTMFELKTFSLEPGGTVPESWAWSHTLDLIGSGGKLTMYFEYRDGKAGNGSTATCIALTMPDGTVYTAANLTDPDTGYNHFVGHISGGYFVHIEEFSEKAHTGAA